MTYEKAQHVRIDTGLCLSADNRRLMVNLAANQVFKA